MSSEKERLQRRLAAFQALVFFGVLFVALGLAVLAEVIWGEW